MAAQDILTDTGGLLVTALVHGANIQDRDGTPAVLASIRYAFPWLRHVFADGAYAGPKLEDALRRLVLPQNSGELFAHSRPAISNWTGLL